MTLDRYDLDTYLLPYWEGNTVYHESVMLLSTTLPNPMAGHYLGCQAAYLPTLEALQTQGTAVADMTGFHQFLLSRKRFCDMSGNNINHPNDFSARAYTQVIWQTAFGRVAF